MQDEAVREAIAHRTIVKAANYDECPVIDKLNTDLALLEAENLELKKEIADHLNTISELRRVSN